MNASEFAAKWSGCERTERAAAQEHFIDLCRMLGAQTPNEADPKGEWYAFERGAEKAKGGDGFADVWKKGHFGWEYKGKRKDLKAAYGQLLQYREALDNPPLLVVCDLDRFEVHTNFTGTTKCIHTFNLNDMATRPEEPLRVLRAVMSNPEALRPTVTREQLTARAAEQFAGLARALRSRGHDPHRVAHFLNKLIFCMFAQDVGLLPAGLIERLADSTSNEVDAFADGLGDLFGKMARAGGRFGVEKIEWFNGGLFDGDEVLALTREEILTVRTVSRLDWSDVEPAIFGTLFERGLDPDSRTALGAHYTDRDSILRVVEPVIIAPLRREFESVKAEINALTNKGKSGAAATKARARAEKLLDGFLDRLSSVKILDPACGSGNFLYIALQSLKDLEHEVIVWAQLSLKAGRLPRVGPDLVHGIEINDYAAELARVTIWIGEIQWMLNHGYGYHSKPILRSLDSIECRDAILDNTTPSLPTEARWPTATFIIGNPPFLGRKLLQSALGTQYRRAMSTVYGRRLATGSDLCCYWFEKARAAVVAGTCERVGLLATQSIRSGSNRVVLDRITSDCRIFSAVSDREWVLGGAMVHVSVVCFDSGSEGVVDLDGVRVPRINADLTSGVDVTSALPLRANRGIAFQGVIGSGDFDVSTEDARRLLELPNPNGQPNAAVLRESLSARDLMGKRSERWIIDFGIDMGEAEACQYEAPFERVRMKVLPFREQSTYARPDRYPYWRFWNPRPELRRALEGLSRYIVTPRHSRHRIFLFVGSNVLPDDSLVAIARDDHVTLGILQSSVHERWARAQGSQLREASSGFRYTPRSCLETFPFPAAAAPTAPIEHAAVELLRLREEYLRATGGTLTELYNRRPTWIAEAHRCLDRAVLRAYGLPDDWADGIQPAREGGANVDPAIGVRSPETEQLLLAELLRLNLGTALNR